MMFCQQIDAYLFTIMQIVPNGLANPFNISQANSAKRTRWLFLNAQPDHSPFGVCHGAIAFPKILRQLALAVPSLCCLTFDIDAFCQRR